MPKFIRKTTKKDLDSEGSIIKSQVEEVANYRETSKPFMALFLQNTTKFNEITAGLTFHALFALCRRVEYNTNEIRLTSKERKRIAEELGKKEPSAINKRIVELVQHGLLAEVAINHYILNPDILFKGDHTKLSAVRNRFIETIAEKKEFEIVGIPE